MALATLNFTTPTLVGVVFGGILCLLGALWFFLMTWDPPRRRRAAVEAATRHANDEITAYQQQYPGRLQFTYGTPKYEKPFLVKAIWNDGQFTYIKAEAKELPAVYEMKDGAPAVVNFQVRGDTYVVPKVLERGYLALGKERFNFQQGR